MIRIVSVPTMTLVPSVTVTGRSVFSRKVRQGTPRAVVSSFMPPLVGEQQAGVPEEVQEFQVGQGQGQTDHIEHS